MPQIARDHVIGIGCIRAFQESIVVFILRRLYAAGGFDAYGGLFERRQKVCRFFTDSRQLPAGENIAIFRKDCLGNTRCNFARNREGCDFGLQPAGFPAGGDKDVCIQHNTHSSDAAIIALSVKDDLGRRMKQDYEDALRLSVPRRTYVVIRIDGRGFHTFTKNLERPYSRRLADALDDAAHGLCQEMIGCRFAYGQSDEYSFLLTDFEKDTASLWFDGNMQKMVSVSASLFTGYFNRAFASDKIAAFDSRLLVISQRAEVEKYFLWRQLDASANSLNMLASAHYSHPELLGKSTQEKHEMLFAKGVNWAKQPADFKRGRVVKRGTNGKTWETDLAIPVFNRDASYLDALIP